MLPTLESNASQAAFLFSASAALAVGGCFLATSGTTVVLATATKLLAARVVGIVIAIFGVSGFIGAVATCGEMSKRPVVGDEDIHLSFYSIWKVKTPETVGLLGTKIAEKVFQNFLLGLFSL